MMLTTKKGSVYPAAAIAYNVPWLLSSYNEHFNLSLEER